MHSVVDSYPGVHFAAAGSSLLRAVALIVLLALPTMVRAQVPVPDTQLWLALVGTLPVNDRWQVQGEFQPRWNQDVSENDQVILRGSVARKVGRGASVWAGYAYTPRFANGGTLHEQRLWQQLSLELPRAGRWVPSLRIRQEERFLNQWTDPSYRLRVLGRFTRSVGTTGWSVVGYDEAMVTFDDTQNGPRQGFDQNRLFAGVLKRLWSGSTIETGYVWQWMPKTPTSRARHNHTVMASFTYAP
jgi:Protein of unknown function (DUF2490)